jgi:hypothetical protein
MRCLSITNRVYSDFVMTINEKVVGCPAADGQMGRM